MQNLDLVLTSTTLVLLLVLTVALVCLRRSLYILYAYAAILVLFTSSGIGAKEQIILIYDRGIGALPLPIMNLFLMACFVFFFFRSLGSNHGSMTVRAFSPKLPLLLLTFYCAAYLAVGFLAGVQYKDVLSGYGVINIINMTLLIFVVSWSINSEKRLSSFTNVILFCLLISSLYGLVRLLFFRGDPANFYGNFEPRGQHLRACGGFEAGGNGDYRFLNR